MEQTSQKDRILAFVEGRIIESGLSKLSVDELTRDLGMSKKTFYKVFATKNAMLEELIGRIIGEVGARVDAIATGRGSFIEKLRSLLNLLGSVYQRLAIPLSEEVHRNLPLVWERVEAFRQQKIQENFTRLLDQGIAEGSIRPDIDKTVFLMAFTAAVRAIVRPSVLVLQAFSAVGVLEQIFQIFFVGILTGSGRAAFYRQPEMSHPH